MNQTEKYDYVMKKFKESMPDAATELNYESPYQLTVAVILSAQCTDKRVNMVTTPFFRKFPTVQSLAVASFEEVEPLIKSVSYANNKTKHLLGMAKIVTDKFEGKIPDNINELMELPGVGRKTANVIISVVYNKPSMAVDTHVFRVSARLGLTTNAKNPLQAELQLLEHIPQDILSIAHHWIILHGRYICVARKPKCNSCIISEACNYFNNQKHASFY